VKGVLMQYALRKWNGSGSSGLQGSLEFQHYSCVTIVVVRCIH
jgi:hypothetical protein